MVADSSLEGRGGKERRGEMKSRGEGKQEGGKREREKKNRQKLYTFYVLAFGFR